MFTHIHNYSVTVSAVKIDSNKNVNFVEKKTKNPLMLRNLANFCSFFSLKRVTSWNYKIHNKKYYFDLLSLLKILINENA